MRAWRIAVSASRPSRGASATPQQAPKRQLVAAPIERLVERRIQVLRKARGVRRRGKIRAQTRRTPTPPSRAATAARSPCPRTRTTRSTVRTAEVEALGHDAQELARGVRVERLHAGAAGAAARTPQRRRSARFSCCRMKKSTSRTNRSWFGSRVTGSTKAISWICRIEASRRPVMLLNAFASVSNSSPVRMLDRRGLALLADPLGETRELVQAARRRGAPHARSAESPRAPGTPRSTGTARARAPPRT